MAVGHPGERSVLTFQTRRDLRLAAIFKNKGERLEWGPSKRGSS